MAFETDFVTGSDTDLVNFTPSVTGTGFTRLVGVQGIAFARAATNSLKTDGACSYLFDGATASADMFVEVTFRGTASANADNRIVFRKQDESNYLAIEQGGASAIGTRVIKVIAGVATNIFTATGVANIIYRMEIVGTDMVFFADGVQEGGTEPVSNFATETDVGIIATGQSNNNWLEYLKVDAISSGATVTPDPISNLQTLSNVTLTQQNVFAVDDISTAQTISSPSLTQQNILGVDDLETIQNISNVSLTVGGALATNDLSNTQTSTEPSLTQAHVLSVDNIETGQTLSNVLLSVAGALEVQGLTQAQVISSVSLVQQHLLNVDDLSQLQTLSNVTLGVEGVLSVDSILSQQTISTSSLITQVALLTDNITNQQFISVVAFDEGQDIGTVTAAFKESGISVNYGIAQFTVKFKE